MISFKITNCNVVLCYLKLITTHICLTISLLKKLFDLMFFLQRVVFFSANVEFVSFMLQLRLFEILLFISLL